MQKVFVVRWNLKKIRSCTLDGNIVKDLESLFDKVNRDELMKLQNNIDPKLMINFYLFFLNQLLYL